MTSCRELDADPIAVLNRWYKTPLGRHVAAAETLCLERLVTDAFGHFLVQVGCGGQFGPVLAASRIRHRIVLGETCGDRGNGVQVCALPLSLPIASASIDAVLLPHTLDFSADPHGVLREVDRVLIPDGRLTLFGFNPFSTWGLLRAWPRRRRRVPWCGGQITPMRLADWLRLLGFQVTARQTLVFRPPLRRAYLSQLDWLELLGGRYWPLFGGIYMIHAVKRTRALTPLRPSWSARAPILPGRAVEPTARERGDA